VQLVALSHFPLHETRPRDKQSRKQEAGSGKQRWEAGKQEAGEAGSRSRKQEEGKGGNRKQEERGKKRKEELRSKGWEERKQVKKQEGRNNKEGCYEVHQVGATESPVHTAGASSNKKVSQN
jgi:hypothetical protein